MAITLAKGILKTLGEEYIEEQSEEIPEPTVEDIKDKRNTGDILIDLLNCLLELFQHIFKK